MRRSIIVSSVLLAFAVTLACCEKSEKKTDPPAATPDPAKSTGGSEPAKKIEEPADTEASAPKLTRKKFGELNTFDYMDILKAAGWTNATSSAMSMGAWEQTTIKAKQGDKEAVITLVAPTGAKDDPNSSVTVQTPKQQLKGLQAKGAAELLKDDLLLAVTIEGDPEGAKKLLAHIKEWIIVE